MVIMHEVVQRPADQFGFGVIVSGLSISFHREAELADGVHELQGANRTHVGILRERNCILRSVSGSLRLVADRPKALSKRIACWQIIQVAKLIQRFSYLRRSIRSNIRRRRRQRSGVLNLTAKATSNADQTYYGAGRSRKVGAAEP